MPIYEYRCTACQHKLESLQKFSDAPLVVCPQCGRDALTKLVSAAGFQLKGNGWYQTDFRNSGTKPAAKPDAPAADTKGSETKTAEATPAAKSDAVKSEAPAAKAETPAASPSTPSSAP